jgi:hypothetical protein
MYIKPKTVVIHVHVIVTVILHDTIKFVKIKVFLLDLLRLFPIKIHFFLENLIVSCNSMNFTQETRIRFQTEFNSIISSLIVYIPVGKNKTTNF